MTDTRAEWPPRSPGGDPAGGTTTPTIADADPERPRAGAQPRLTLLHGFARSALQGDEAGRKPDLRVVWAAAEGAPAVVHSTRPGTPAAPEPGRPLAGAESGDRSGTSREERHGGLRLIGRPGGRRPALAAMPCPHASQERPATSPLAATPEMRDDATGAVALSGGNLTLASLRETLEMERPL